MVEIAVWRRIEQILGRHQALQGEECMESHARKVRDILLDDDSEENHPRDIAFRMGDIYRDVVKVCLKGDFGVIQDPLNAFKERVVDQLGRCVI